MKIESAADTGGWKSGEKGLEIVWTRLPAVPTACLDWLVGCLGFNGPWLVVLGLTAL